MCRHHSKVDNSSTTVNFCDIPEDGGDGKSSQWEELWAIPLAIYFAWKEKQLKMQLYTNSWAVATGLAAWLGTWKKHYWKIGVKEICSRGIQVGPSKWAKMWRYLYLMWLLTKEWPRQTRIVIIKWIRWPSFVTVNLFLQLPLPLPNGLMNKETMVSWVKNMHGLSTMVFPWPQTTWLWTLLSGVITQLPGGRLITWTVSIMDWATFCSYWNTHLFWMQICLPCMQCFFQNYHLWTHRIPYASSWYGTLHCFWPRNALQSKRNAAMGHGHRIHWSYNVPPLLKTSCIAS